MSLRVISSYNCKTTCFRERKHKYGLLLIVWLGVSFGTISYVVAGEIPPIQISLIGYANALHIELESVRNATKYEIRYSTDSLMRDAIYQKVVATEVELPRMKTDTRYYIQARVSLNGKWSAWSATKTCKTASYSVSIGTYNILSSKYDKVFPNNMWASRKKEMEKIILQSDNRPDILAIQEGMIDAQVDDLVNSLKNTYVSHVSKRKISARAIFWKPEKFELVEFDDDIDMLDKNVAGSINQRFANCICLKEKTTGNKLLVFNIHLPASYLADRRTIRNVMVSFIAEKAKGLAESRDNIPVIILGDFNDVLTVPSTEEILPAPNELEKRGFTDSYRNAINTIHANYSTHDRITKGTASSANYLKGENAKRIDYIFYYPDNKVQVSDYHIVINFERDSGSVLRKPIPSDHRPIKSVLHIFN